MSLSLTVYMTSQDSPLKITRSQAGAGQGAPEGSLLQTAWVICFSLLVPQTQLLLFCRDGCCLPWQPKLSSLIRPCMPCRPSTDAGCAVVDVLAQAPVGIASFMLPRNRKHCDAYCI